MSVVIAAIDLGPSSVRVLYHAAGFARLLSMPLVILHVSGETPAVVQPQLTEFCERAAPYQINPDDVEMVVRAGTVSEAIYREARRRNAALVVLGARGHGGFARLLLGSTSEAVLGNAPVPVLLVPPVDLDIINISDRPTLNCGPVIAAIDLAEGCERQLSLAGCMARLARQPLLLMTVASRRLDDHDAAAQLRERAHALEPVRPRAVIVRRGDVAEEISRCAVVENAGLVVMGLRASGRGHPGAIASAVLATKRAFCIAVPGA